MSLVSIEDEEFRDARVQSFNQKAKIIVYKNGTWKLLLSGVTWEYENDPEWLVTIKMSDTNEFNWLGKQ